MCFRMCLILRHIVCLILRHIVDKTCFSLKHISKTSHCSMAKYTNFNNIGARKRKFGSPESRDDDVRNGVSNENAFKASLTFPWNELICIVWSSCYIIKCAHVCQMSNVNL